MIMPCCGGEEAEKHAYSGFAWSEMMRTPQTRQLREHHRAVDNTRERKIRPNNAVKKIFDCWMTAKVPASTRFKLRDRRIVTRVES